MGEATFDEVGFLSPSLRLGILVLILATVK